MGEVTCHPNSASGEAESSADIAGEMGANPSWSLDSPFASGRSCAKADALSAVPVAISATLMPSVLTAVVSMGASASRAKLGTRQPSPAHAALALRSATSAALSTSVLSPCSSPLFVLRSPLCADDVASNGASSAFAALASANGHACGIGASQLRAPSARAASKGASTLAGSAAHAGVNVAARHSSCTRFSGPPKGSNGWRSRGETGVCACACGTGAIT